MHKRSKEALFAYYIDKFECDIQCKYYDETGCCDMNNVKKCEDLLEDLRRHDALDNDDSFSQIWIGYDKKFCHMMKLSKTFATLFCHTKYLRAKND